MNSVDKIYRGPYAKFPCKHCGVTLEAGPLKLAGLEYCAHCNGPIHNKLGCNNFCPKIGQWDPRREEARIFNA